MSYQISCVLAYFVQNGLTPLHLSVFYALEYGDYSTMSTLLDCNANCFAENNVCFHSSLC